ncbi:WD repeat-containing protein 88 PQQ repeat and [Collichthys lucidus]|uniref:WD repeat-containing protein 88 PQQ repeat and n=1 Tax=Collichthys lucidus TaxID=240159 RepID=A0A4V6ALU7_COLLU|nr:WD repeat-containing protein 88 PQQ repeat and [Collichthys lucidus]
MEGQTGDGGVMEGQTGDGGVMEGQTANMASTDIDPLSVHGAPERGAEEQEAQEAAGGGAEWSRETRVPVKVLGAHSGVVTAARLCFSDRCVLSCSADRTSVLWDVDSCRPLRVFDGVHARTITECALIPNTNRMVTVSWDKTMVVSDVETGQILWRWGQSGLLTSCGSSSDGRLLVCASDPQNAIHVVDAGGGQTLHHVSGTTARTLSAA